MKTSKGFTLIELLIVIAILGILAAGILVAINPLSQLQKARDATRKYALKQISTALESYYVANSHYPITITGNPESHAGGNGWYADCWRLTTNWIPDNGNYDVFSSELKTIPHDPIDNCQWPYEGGSGAATYAYASDGTSFALAVRLENHSDSDRTEVKHYIFPWTGANTATFSGPGSPYVYWITNK